MIRLLRFTLITLMSLSLHAAAQDTVRVSHPDSVLPGNRPAARASFNSDSTLRAVLVVSSTRTNDPVEYSTTKVEVLGQAELNEESVIRPANVASILGDVSGVQVQQSSVVSGNTNVRILGLDGKYTQLLRDGMPIYEGFSGGFGVLSIPPLDLQQLELIKGSASTLYGGGAIAGLINFISRTPTTKQEFTAILNQTTLNETNVNLYASKRVNRFGYTFFMGQTWQNEVDVNRDGFSDLPRLTSTIVHPTLFFYPSAKTRLSLGWTGSFEKRNGGDMMAIHDRNLADHPYFENNVLHRNTLALIGDSRSAKVHLQLKASYGSFRRLLVSNTSWFRGKQENLYTELSADATVAKHHLVAGLNFTGNYFTPSPETPVAVGTIGNTAAGIFTQDSWKATANTTIEAGLRLDRTWKYGEFLLPRIAIFHHFNPAWGARAGFGMGYKVPDPLVPQVKDYEFAELDRLPGDIRAERSAGINLEFNYKAKWGDGNSLFINHAFFYTGIRHAVIATEQPGGRVSFSNAGARIDTRGTDTYLQLEIDDVEMYLGYTFTDAKRKYLDEHQSMPLTPRNRAASTVVFEPLRHWRFGVECSWNDDQARDDDTGIRSYFLLAGMIERKIGDKVSVILNAENLLDARQSRYQGLFTGSVTRPVFRAIGTPLEGRVINLSVRWTPYGGKKS